mmetsp:Transcript_3544/g.11021  ORF Transcript_3544/g.11021 Transcript_3544/m.11021 type:complete len:210 (-) Transcript_3544:126-755(-)
MGEAGAAVEDRLEATPELQLKIRTASLDLWLKLTKPVAAWDGARYAGFVSDTRPAFGDFCHRGLYLDQISGWGKPGSPTSSDPALLRALTASSKVVAERRLEPRSDVSGSLKISADGVKLTENLLAEVKQGDKPAGGLADMVRPSPAEEILTLGKQSVFSGAIFLAAGAIYVARWYIQDPNDADNKKDPTVHDLFVKLQGGLFGTHGQR